MRGARSAVADDVITSGAATCFVAALRPSMLVHGYRKGA